MCTDQIPVLELIRCLFYSHNEHSLLRLVLFMTLRFLIFSLLHRLFETHPDVQDAFMDFRHMSLEDMRHSKTLREHGLRVMTTVEKVLARVDDPAKLDAFLHHLGTKHVNYNANKNYIQVRKTESQYRMLALVTYRQIFPVHAHYNHAKWIYLFTI